MSSKLLMDTAASVNNKAENMSESVDDKYKALREALQNLPIRPIPKDIDKPIPVRSVTYEYEWFITTLCKARSYVIYPKDGTMRCLLCQKIIRSGHALHALDPDHIVLLRAHQKRLDIMTQNEQKAIAEEILDSLDRYEKYTINIDVLEGTAECKLCKKKLYFDPELIDRHIADHDKLKKFLETRAVSKDDRDVEMQDATAVAEVPQKQIPKKSQMADEPRAVQGPVTKPENKACGSVNNNEKEDFAKTNNITFNYGENTAFCNICKSKLPISLKCLQEHVAGGPHKKLVAKSLIKDTKIKPQPKFTKLPMNKFINSFSWMENFGDAYIIINNKFLINYRSIHFTVKADGNVRCLICHAEFADTVPAIQEHTASVKHFAEQWEEQIILSYESEFIREIQPEQYHCGYCNRIEKGSYNLEKHLTTVEHKENRTAAEWRLKEFTKERIVQIV